jgi:hypothetical protein
MQCDLEAGAPGKAVDFCGVFGKPSRRFPEARFGVSFRIADIELNLYRSGHSRGANKEVIDSRTCFALAGGQ